VTWSLPSRLCRCEFEHRRGPCRHEIVTPMR
jgi:hypothetical protein